MTEYAYDMRPEGGTIRRKARELGEQAGQEAGQILGTALREVIKVNPGGGAKGVKPERYELIPWDAMDVVARVYAFGADKYDDHNWRKGIPFGDHWAALIRHARAWWEGEECDPESRESHMGHVVFHALALIKAVDEHPDMDNRYKGETASDSSD